MKLKRFIVTFGESRKFPSGWLLYGAVQNRSSVHLAFDVFQSINRLGGPWTHAYQVHIAYGRGGKNLMALFAGLTMIQQLFLKFPKD